MKNVVAKWLLAVQKTYSDRDAKLVGLLGEGNEALQETIKFLGAEHPLAFVVNRASTHPDVMTSESMEEQAALANSKPLAMTDALGVQANLADILTRLNNYDASLLMLSESLFRTAKMMGTESSYHSDMSMILQAETVAPLFVTEFYQQQNYERTPYTFEEVSGVSASALRSYVQGEGVKRFFDYRVLNEKWGVSTLPHDAQPIYKLLCVAHDFGCQVEDMDAYLAVTEDSWVPPTAEIESIGHLARLAPHVWPRRNLNEIAAIQEMLNLLLAQASTQEAKQNIFNELNSLDAERARVLIEQMLELDTQVALLRITLNEDVDNAHLFNEFLLQWGLPRLKLRMLQHALGQPCEFKPEELSLELHFLKLLAGSQNFLLGLRIKIQKELSVKINEWFSKDEGLNSLPVEDLEDLFELLGELDKIKSDKLVFDAVAIQEKRALFGNQVEAVVNSPASQLRQEFLGHTQIANVSGETLFGSADHTLLKERLLALIQGYFSFAVGTLVDRIDRVELNPVMPDDASREAGVLYLTEHEGDYSAAMRGLTAKKLDAKQSQAVRALNPAGFQTKQIVTNVTQVSDFSVACRYAADPSLIDKMLTVDVATLIYLNNGESSLRSKIDKIFANRQALSNFLSLSQLTQKSPCLRLQELDAWCANDTSLQSHLAESKKALLASFPKSASKSASLDDLAFNAIRDVFHTRESLVAYLQANPQDSRSKTKRFTDLLDWACERPGLVDELKAAVIKHVTTTAQEASSSAFSDVLFDINIVSQLSPDFSVFGEQASVVLQKCFDQTVLHATEGLKIEQSLAKLMDYCGNDEKLKTDIRHQSLMCFAEAVRAKCSGDESVVLVEKFLNFGAIQYLKKLAVDPSVLNELVKGIFSSKTNFLNYITETDGTLSSNRLMDLLTWIPKTDDIALQLAHYLPVIEDQLNTTAQTYVRQWFWTSPNASAFFQEPAAAYSPEIQASAIRFLIHGIDWLASADWTTRLATKSADSLNLSQRVYTSVVDAFIDQANNIDEAVVLSRFDRVLACCADPVVLQYCIEQLLTERAATLPAILFEKAVTHFLLSAQDQSQLNELIWKKYLAQLDATALRYLLECPSEVEPQHRINRLCLLSNSQLSSDADKRLTKIFSTADINEVIPMLQRMNGSNLSAVRKGLLQRPNIIDECRSSAGRYAIFRELNGGAGHTASLQLNYISSDKFLTDDILYIINGVLGDVNRDDYAEILRSRLWQRDNLLNDVLALEPGCEAQQQLLSFLLKDENLVHGFSPVSPNDNKPAFFVLAESFSQINAIEAGKLFFIIKIFQSGANFTHFFQRSTVDSRSATERMRQLWQWCGDNAELKSHLKKLFLRCVLDHSIEISESNSALKEDFLSGEFQTYITENLFSLEDSDAPIYQSAIKTLQGKNYRATLENILQAYPSLQKDGSLPREIKALANQFLGKILRSGQKNWNLIDFLSSAHAEDSLEDSYRDLFGAFNDSPAISAFLENELTNYIRDQLTQPLALNVPSLLLAIVDVAVLNVHQVNAILANPEALYAFLTIPSVHDLSPTARIESLLQSIYDADLRVEAEAEIAKYFFADNAGSLQNLLLTDAELEIYITPPRIVLADSDALQSFLRWQLAKKPPVSVAISVVELAAQYPKEFAVFLSKNTTERLEAIVQAAGSDFVAVQDVKRVIAGLFFADVNVPRERQAFPVLQRSKVAAYLVEHVLNDDLCTLGLCQREENFNGLIINEGVNNWAKKVKAERLPVQAIPNVMAAQAFQSLADKTLQAVYQANTWVAGYIRWQQCKVLRANVQTIAGLPISDFVKVRLLNNEIKRNGLAIPTLQPLMDRGIPAAVAVLDRSLPHATPRFEKAVSHTDDTIWPAYAQLLIKVKAYESEHVGWFRSAPPSLILLKQQLAVINATTNLTLDEKNEAGLRVMGLLNASLAKQDYELNQNRYWRAFAYDPMRTLLMGMQQQVMTNATITAADSLPKWIIADQLTFLIVSMEALQNNGKCQNIGSVSEKLVLLKLLIPKSKDPAPLASGTIGSINVLLEQIASAIEAVTSEQSILAMAKEAQAYCKAFAGKIPVDVEQIEAGGHVNVVTGLGEIQRSEVNQPASREVLSTASIMPVHQHKSDSQSGSSIGSNVSLMRRSISLMSRDNGEGTEIDEVLLLPGNLEVIRPVPSTPPRQLGTSSQESSPKGSPPPDGLDLNPIAVNNYRNISNTSVNQGLASHGHHRTYRVSDEGHSSLAQSLKALPAPLIVGEKLRSSSV